MTFARYVCLLSVVFLCFGSSDARAWGRTGHKVVCLIAYEGLTDEARRQVDALMALDPEFEHFADSCSWADSPRKRSAEHYLNVSRKTRPGAIVGCGDAEQCVMSAIVADLKIVGEKTASVDDRLAALKFLAHWVGDIHQPLHVSFADDRGANDIETGGLCRGSLHGAWDGCILERAFGIDADAVAAALLAGRPSASAGDAGASDQWAKESYEIAVDPATRYCVQTAAGCAYSRESFAYDAGAPKRVEIIDQRYIDQNKDVIARRLERAGARLAALLNAALTE